MSNNLAFGIYIMVNPTHSVIYIGASTYLPDRIQVHKDKTIDGFTKTHNCTKLVYFELLPDIDSAYLREKQLKGWTRKKKVNLINSKNPRWEDLFSELISLVAP